MLASLSLGNLAMDNGENKSPDGMDITLQRARELKASGLDWHHALGRAWLERRIEEWPSGWGDDLQILIFGDFKPPDGELHIPTLEITVYPEKLENTIIRSAMTVLRAKVKIKEKNIDAIVDAVRRVNILLGSFTLVEWGNGACGWWSHVTHGSAGGVLTTLANENLQKAIDGILRLPRNIRHKVDAALYWVREPRNLLMEFHRNDLLRIYSSYWNALECLVDAACILRPQPKPTKAENKK